MTTYFDHYAKQSRQPESIPMDEALKTSVGGIEVVEHRIPNERMAIDNFRAISNKAKRGEHQ